MFEFNTVVDNALANGDWLECFHDPDNGPVRARNTIIYSTSGLGENAAGDCTWTYSNVATSSGLILDGEGNLNEDPGFLNPESEDYRLGGDSPCVDAADPSSTLDADFERGPATDRRRPGHRRR